MLHRIRKVRAVNSISLPNRRRPTHRKRERLRDHGRIFPTIWEMWCVQRRRFPQIRGIATLMEMEQEQEREKSHLPPFGRKATRIRPKIRICRCQLTLTAHEPPKWRELGTRWRCSITCQQSQD